MKAVPPTSEKRRVGLLRMSPVSPGPRENITLGAVRSISGIAKQFGLAIEPSRYSNFVPGAP
jgi:hypothetical protein